MYKTVPAIQCPRCSGYIDVNRSHICVISEGEMRIKSLIEVLRERINQLEKELETYRRRQNETL